MVAHQSDLLLEIAALRHQLEVLQRRGAGHASGVKTVDSGFDSPVAGRCGEVRMSSSSLARSLAGIVRAIVYFGRQRWPPRSIWAGPEVSVGTGWLALEGDGDSRHSDTTSGAELQRDLCVCDGHVETGGAEPLCVCQRPIFGGLCGNSAAFTNQPVPTWSSEYGRTPRMRISRSTATKTPTTNQPLDSGCGGGTDSSTHFSMTSSSMTQLMTTRPSTTCCRPQHISGAITEFI
jgi:hypothetical protein